MELLTPDELLEWYKNLTHEQKQTLANFLDANLKLPEVDTTRHTHKAKGRLVFQHPDKNGKDIPIHNMLVEFYDHDTWSPDDFLGTAITDLDGYFEIMYDPSEFQDKVQLVEDKLDPELRILETYHIYDKSGNIKITKKVIDTIRQDRVEDLKEIYDFGTLRIPFWEYETDSPVPRVLILEHGDPPQSYSPGRTTVMLKHVAPLEALKWKHIGINKLDSSRPTIQTIQNDYPESLTVQLEKENPGITRSDEYFGERMMNGMSASIIDQDPQHPGWYRLYHHWNSYEQDGIHAMPNVDMRFEMKDGLLIPVQISFNLRKPGVTEPNGPTEKITVTPADGDKWMAAKRIARVSAALSAELDNHLCTTHLNAEQYAIAAYRNIRKNPIRNLLFPHIKEVVLINHTADSMLLGEGFIVRSTAFTEQSILHRLQHVMGGLDWKNWKPRKPISDKHTYAKAAWIYWDMITEYVNISMDNNKDEIAKHWYEIYRFSNEVMEHAVPFFLCNYLQKYVQMDPENSGWFDGNERIDLSVPRYKVDGIEKAVSPITLSENMDEESFTNMKQLCAYIIYHTTFAHTWANSKQYDDVGEILYNCLGLRYGNNGIFVPESDLSIANTIPESTEMMWISFLLSKTGHGFIMSNEDQDIHPDLIDALNARKDDFAALGMDIHTIQSRTNI